MKIIAGILLSYFLGALPTAYLITKQFKGIDIRHYGSGNVGATNVLRVIGKLPAILVLVIDLGKGLLAVTLIYKLLFATPTAHPETIKALFGLAAVCGHIFSIFLKFKGGKGVATSAGVIIGIAPPALIFAAAVFLLTLATSKYVSLASMTAVVVLPFYLLFNNYQFSYIVLTIFLCILIVLKHQKNIKRLLNGSERKIFKK